MAYLGHTLAMLRMFSYSPGDCAHGRCPSHDACPDRSYCCVDSAHVGCIPPGTTVSEGGANSGEGACLAAGGIVSEDLTSCCPAACGICGGDAEECAERPGGSRACCTASIQKAARQCASSGGKQPPKLEPLPLPCLLSTDAAGDGWKLVFRQVLPSRDRRNGGYFAAEDVAKNSDTPEASTFSLLDQLHTMRGDDGAFEFKLKYPNLSGDGAHLHWKQSVDPMSGHSLLTSEFEWVRDERKMWHVMYVSEACEPTLDVGEDAFNAFFARTKTPLVRCRQGFSI